MAASTLQMRDPTSVQEGWHQTTQRVLLCCYCSHASGPNQQSLGLAPVVCRPCLLLSWTAALRAGSLQH